MKRRIPTLRKVQRVTRARVCAGCPYRTPGTRSFNPDQSRACEAKCPLFGRLGVLREIARNLEPMVGHRSEVLARIVASLRRQPHESADVVRRNRSRVLALYEELFDD